MRPSPSTRFSKSVLFHHLQGFERHGGAERIGGKCRVRGPGREEFRRDQLLTRPNARKWIQTICQRLAEDNDVRRDAEILNRPELAGAIEAHLDFVVHNQDFVLAASFLQALESIRAAESHSRRFPAPPRCRRRRTRRTWPWRPRRRYIRCQRAGRIGRAVKIAGLGLQFISAAEAVGIKNKLPAIAEVSVAPSVAIAGSDGGSAQRAAVIPALEGKHQVFAGVIAHDLQRIFNSLRTAHVEVDAAFDAETLFAILSNASPPLPPFPRGGIGRQAAAGGRSGASVHRPGAGFCNQSWPPNTTSANRGRACRFRRRDDNRRNRQRFWAVQDSAPCRRTSSTCARVPAVPRCG